MAGSTGLVGQALVRQLAAERTWREVRALVRHALPPDLSVPNVVSVQVEYDRLDPPPDWPAADHVFCALGTTMRQAGSPEAFRRVDFRVPGGASSGSAGSRRSTFPPGERGWGGAELAVLLQPGER